MRSDHTPSIVLITDHRYSTDHIAHVVESVAGAIGGGELLVQLRDKHANRKGLAILARALRDATKRIGVAFAINAIDPNGVCSIDALQVGRDVGADGVHVPCNPESILEARNMHYAWISTPAHSDDDVAVSRDAAANAVLVSPIWASPGKQTPRGISAIASARALLSARAEETNLRIYALGGVDATNAADARIAGADGVAVIRALLDYDDNDAINIVDVAKALAHR